MTIQTNNVQVSKAGIVVDYTDNSGAAVQQTLSFANKTLSVNSGFNVASGDSSLAGALNVSGISNLNNALNVAGASALGSSLAVTGVSNLNNTLNIAGVSNLNNALNVSGAAALGGSLAVTGAANLNNALNVSGASALSGSLAVAGVSNMNNALNVSGSAALSGSLAVTGAVNMSSTLDVTGATHLHNTLNIDGPPVITTLSNGSVALSNSNITNTIYNSRGGSIVIPQDANGMKLLSISFFGTGALNAGGSAKIYFNFSAPGPDGAYDGYWINATTNRLITLDMTFGNTFFYTLTGGQTLGINLSTLSGSRYFNAVLNPDSNLALQITYGTGSSGSGGAATLGSTLTVTGATVLNNNTTVNGTSALNGALTVSGASSLGGALNVTGAGAFSSTMDVTGAAHLFNTLVVDQAATLGSSLAVAGASNLNGVLNVVGASHLSSTLLADGATTLGSSLVIAGAANMSDVLNVAGASHLSSTLLSDGAATLGSSLAVAGASNMSGVLNVVGASHLSSTLLADGAATLGSSLAVAGASNLNGVMNVAGASALGSTLAVTGAATMNNTLAVAGATTVGGAFALSGAASFNNTLGVAGNATFQQNVTVNGNMTVLGNQTAIDTTSLQVKDNAILIADNNTTDTLESGVMVQYQPNGASAPKYAGVKRRPVAGSAGGEFVFFKDADSQISLDGSSNSSSSSSSSVYSVGSNTAAINQTPSIYLPCDAVPANSSVSQGSSPSTLTVVGPPTSVAGVIGTNAIRLANTAGGSGTQHITGTCSLGANFTVSMWFNAQSAPDGQMAIFVISAALNSSSIFLFLISASGNLLVQYLNSNSNYTNMISYPILFNKWYNLTAIIQSGGTSSVYLNNILIGTSSFTLYSTNNTNFTIARITESNPSNQAFNGYIDDLKIYNTAIPFTPMVPMNYSYVSMSSNGQYMLAAATNGGLFMSSDKGSSWAQVTGVTSNGLWSGLSLSSTGQTMVATQNPRTGIMPQLTGLPSSGGNLTTSSWMVNEVTWIASASSIYHSTFPVSNTFNNAVSDGNTWASGSLYNAATSGASGGNYTGSTSTTIVGSSALLGEVLTIQSSIPLVMSSYAFGSAGWFQYPRIYAIVGSNDGTNWYLVQSVTMANGSGSSGGPGGATNYSAPTSYITVNQSGSQTVTTTGGSANITTTSYSSSTNAYTYFRVSTQNVFYTGGGASQFAIGEWFINFTSGGQSYSTNYGSTWTTAYNAPISVAPSLSGNGQYLLAASGAVTNTNMPNLTGLAANTWTTNGVNWTASASNVLSATAHPAYAAFNNYYGSAYPFSWAGLGNQYNGANYTYSSDIRTTVLGGVGSIGGEWIQIQSSIPLVMQSYTYACGGSIPNLPKSGYIVGSNDNSTWYPIQSWTMTTNPITTGYTTCTSYITVNQSGAQNIQGNVTGSGTFTTYSTTTNAYTYFRCIYTGIWGAGVAEMGEWFINFAKGDNKIAYVVSSAPSGVSSSYTNPTLASINANIVGTACSSTGQYQVIVTAGATNNVYYSMDYGVTFTAMSVGSSAMVSCTMSDDGSTITATNAYTVYTITKGNIATLSIAPFVAMPLSSNLIDSLSGLSSITTVGSVSYSTIGGKTAAYFANTAMGPQANRIYGTSATPFSSMTGWSISCSFNISELPSQHFSTVWGVGNSNCGIYLSILSTGNVEFMWYTSGNVQKKITSSAVVSINTWNNVVVAFSNNGAINAYLNGANFGTVTNNNLGYLTGSTSIVSFGGDTRSNITVFGYKGYISDIKIYNGVLSSADVTALVTPISSSASDVYAVVLADSFNCASDLNLKKNIVPLDNVLDKLDEMRGVYHDWIDENQPQVRQVGVIAQEVQSVYPELVNVGGDGHLSVNYPKLTAVLLESVKELKVKVMDRIKKKMEKAAAESITV